MDAQRIDRYWSDRFGLKPEVLQEPGILVVPHARPRKADDSFAFAFVRASTCALSVGAALVETTRERVSKWLPDSLLSETNLRQVFGRPIHRTVGPAYQGYSEKEDFAPLPSKLVRKLDREERDVLQRLRAACEPIAWEHSGIDRADSPLFGYFLGDDLVAVAHYSMWADDTASIGVLTHPAYRSRGYGKVVVSAAMTDAFAHGYLVLYQTLVANHPSVRLATALGCQDYARTMAVHLVDDTAEQLNRT